MLDYYFVVVKIDQDKYSGIVSANVSPDLVFNNVIDKWAEAKKVESREVQIVEFNYLKSQ